MVTDQAMPDFNGKHCVFGEVINDEGKDIVDRIIEEAGTDYADDYDHHLMNKPTKLVVVTNSGVLKEGMTDEL